MPKKPDDRAGDWVCTFSPSANGKTLVLLQDSKEFTWLRFPTPKDKDKEYDMRYAALMKVLSS